jgi:hypothetical protein
MRNIFNTVLGVKLLENNPSKLTGFLLKRSKQKMHPRKVKGKTGKHNVPLI